MARLLIVANIPAMMRDFLLPYAVHFQRQGWRVDAMAWRISESRECTQTFDRVWDVRWSRQPFHWSNVLAPRRVRQIVEREQYSLVHVHTPVSALLTRYALRHLRGSEDGPKVVYTAHGFYFSSDGPGWSNKLSLQLEKIGSRWTDYLVVMNREDEQAARRHALVPPERLVYMPGIGLDTERFYHPDSVSEEAIRKVRLDLGLTEKTPLILMAAEFKSAKRHEDALDAFARMRHRTAHLVLAGDGVLMNSMRGLAGRLGLGDRIHFLGFRSDIPMLMRAAQVLLLPSDREGLPRCIMEAMSLGLPVVASLIRGNVDLLENGRGVLVPLGDRAGFATGLDWILDHPAEARKMASLARLEIQDYDIRRLLAMHEALYSQALPPGVPRASEPLLFPASRHSRGGDP